LTGATPCRATCIYLPDCASLRAAKGKLGPLDRAAGERQLNSRLISSATSWPIYSSFVWPAGRPPSVSFWSPAGQPPSEKETETETRPQCTRAASVPSLRPRPHFQQPGPCPIWDCLRSANNKAQQLAAQAMRRPFYWPPHAGTSCQPHPGASPPEGTMICSARALWPILSACPNLQIEAQKWPHCLAALVLPRLVDQLDFCTLSKESLPKDSLPRGKNYIDWPPKCPLGATSGRQWKFIWKFTWTVCAGLSAESLTYCRGRSVQRTVVLTNESQRQRSVLFRTHFERRKDFSNDPEEPNAALSGLNLWVSGAGH